MGVNSITQQKDLQFKIITKRIQYTLASLTIFSAKENLSGTLCASKNERVNMVSFNRRKFGTEGYRSKTLLKTFSVINFHVKVFKAFH